MIEVHTEPRWDKIDGWGTIFIGFYDTPKGFVRSCGHQHGSFPAAERCARILSRRVWREQD